MCIRSVIRFYTIFYFTLIVSVTGNGQIHYSFDRINTESGLPTNAIKGIYFDNQTRFLWVATESGILRYNGYNFKSFGEPGDKKKLDGRIVQFFKRSDNTIAGTTTDAKVFTIDKNKVIYPATKSPLYYADEYVRFKYNLSGNTPVKNPQDIGTHTFYLQGNYYHISNDRLYIFKKLKEFELVKQFEAGGNYFVINNKLIRLDSKLSSFEYDLSDEIIETKIPNNIQHKEGQKSNYLRVFQDFQSDPVYFLSGNTLLQPTFKNDSLVFTKIISDIPFQDPIRFLQKDSITNTFYFGTDNKGLILARPSYFKRVLPSFTVPQSSASAYAQVLMSNGNIQVNSGIIFGKKNSLDLNSLPFNLPAEPNTYITKKGELLSTNYLGLYGYAFATSRRIIYSQDNFLKKRITYVEKGDTIYLFTSEGVAFLHNGVVSKRLIFKKRPLAFDVHDAVLMDDNTILLATSHGIYRYSISANRFSLFYIDPNEYAFRTIFKYSNYYFIGSYGGGIYIIHNNIIKPLILDKEEFTRFVHCFIKFNNDFLMSTNKGLFRVNIHSMIQSFDKSLNKQVYTHYGKSDGIDVLEMNGGCTPCFLKLPDNSLSIPGIEGLIQFDPQKLPSQLIHPILFIDKVSIDENDFTEEEFISKKIGPAINFIDISIAISGMLSKENVEVEYKYGTNKTWRAIDIDNASVRIENPSYGTNRLLIRWRNTASTVWSFKKIPFTVLYPWYAHPLSFLGYFLLILVLFYVFLRYRTIAYANTQKKLETEVALKTAHLKNINKYLSDRDKAKSQVIAIMNHDVLTPLKYLHLTAKNVEGQLVDDALKKSVEQMAITTKELEYLTSNMLNWVKYDDLNSLPPVQSIDLFLLANSIIDFVTPFTEKKPIVLVNEIPVGTMIHSWQDPLRILIYNLLLNAINATAAGSIVLSYRMQHSKYEIRITDNGDGMTNEEIENLLQGKTYAFLNKNNRVKKGNGIGYQIIRHLVKLMKAKIAIRSEIGKGTQVILQFKQ